MSCHWVYDVSLLEGWVRPSLTERISIGVPGRGSSALEQSLISPSTQTRLTPTDAATTMEPAQASAPLRIDMGATVDIAPLALYYRHRDPATVNLCLDLRTTVSIEPIKAGIVQVQSGGFVIEQGDPDTSNFSGPLGLYFYLCGLFRVSGVRVKISSAAPPRCGLGGSGAALVALIAALDSVQPLSSSPLTRAEIALLAYRIEASFYTCGMQDHLAAAFGGVNLWHWGGPSTGDFFRREALLSSEQLPQLSAAIQVLHTGTARDSMAMNDDCLSHFVSGSDRHVWVQLINLSHEFARAIRDSRFDHAAEVLKEEMSIRRASWPESTTEQIDAFVREAESAGCGAKFAGGGRGGCVWAIGTPACIQRLRARWGELSREIPGANLLTCSLTGDGVSSKVLTR